MFLSSCVHILFLKVERTLVKCLVFLDKKLSALFVVTRIIWTCHQYMSIFDLPNTFKVTCQILRLPALSFI